MKAEAKEQLDTIRSHVPLASTGQPSDVVAVMVFLASNAPSFITCATVVADGGWLA